MSGDTQVPEVLGPVGASSFVFPWREWYLLHLEAGEEATGVNPFIPPQGSHLASGAHMRLSCTCVSAKCLQVCVTSCSLWAGPQLGPRQMTSRGLKRAGAGRRSNTAFFVWKIVSSKRLCKSLYQSPRGPQDRVLFSLKACRVVHSLCLLLIFPKKCGEGHFSVVFEMLTMP